MYIDYIGNIVLHMVNFMIMIIMFNSCIKGMCVMIFELEQKKEKEINDIFFRQVSDTSQDHKKHSRLKLKVKPKFNSRLVRTEIFQLKPRIKLEFLSSEPRHYVFKIWLYSLFFYFYSFQFPNTYIVLCLILSDSIVFFFFFFFAKFPQNFILCSISKNVQSSKQASF